MARRLDAILILLCFVCGAALARSALQAEARAGVPPAFYQRWLPGAVLEACGRGYREPELDRVPPALADFLALKADRVSCDDIPADTPLVPANWYAQMHRYLGLSLSTIWRLRGIRWSAIGPLFEIFSGLTAALIYALFRLGTNRWWAFAGAIAIASSGLNLFHLHLLRDYSKGPFLLASLLVCGYLVTRPYSARRLLALSLLAGAIVGCGFGFRTDAIVAVPVFLMVPLILLPAPLRPTIGTRALALAAFASAFVVTAWPILSAYSHGSNSAHVTLLGFSEPFGEALGLAPTHYRLNTLYADRPVEVAARAYDMATTGGSGWTTLTSQSYDRMTGNFLRAVTALLPADFLIHGYAAIARIIDSPFDRPGELACERLRPSLAGTACHARNVILSPLRPFALAAVAAVLILVCAVDFRRGAFLCAVVAVFAGSLTLQYDPRHAFYLEFLSLWALAFLGQRAMGVPNALRSMWTAGWSDRAVRARLLRGVAVAAALVIAPAGALMFARAQQQRGLETLFARYLAADVDPLPLVWRTENAGIATVTADNWLPPLDPAAFTTLGLRSAFIRADFGGPSCPGRVSPLVVRYYLSFAGYVGGQATVIPIEPWAPGATQHVFFPVYRALIGLPGAPAPSGELRVTGLELPPAEASCLIGLSAIRDASAFPVRLMVSLGPDWQSRQHYQVMAPVSVRAAPQ